ncbi:Hypothetical protein MIP_06587 [Mycobacterium intracellulare subsp. intracellulare MTCC 9506]|uniref:Uncharacterized protein n=1 Tax=Mycobacterium indicus pranii (strain DSM 45239 / MTCC 9506) TaxID=1232724 RepID=J9WM84_MYCIP|nr:Hypothetical protein MIP_06587 [Mycobacterium intracellulare subsp. intracellulare MTCC 9506]ETZ27705.1 hypothetical protein L842_4601 [Mycobacterium intracellulare MIN_052511_1280]
MSYHPDTRPDAPVLPPRRALVVHERHMPRSLDTTPKPRPEMVYLMD